MPDQSGRVALVTGANSGIGEPTARELARAGAHVVLACRNPDKAEAASARIRAEVPEASLDVVTLDLSDLASVDACATAFREKYDRLDLLINNAGIMAPPYTRTVDGFELQLGTNHLGPFALTGHLFELWGQTPKSRVVTVSSMAHRFGAINFADLHHERRYIPWRAYGQSKVANLFFTYELQRRLQSRGLESSALAAHPGWTHTNIVQHTLFLVRWLSPVLAQSAARGAEPTLRAATDPDVAPGSYYGPSGLGETRGHAVRVRSTRYSQRVDIAAQLWAQSEQVTGVQFL
jgi:NAD(P)-dependent dehydrogenase (short-subunit alcohol dehydrogenase family)